MNNLYAWKQIVPAKLFAVVTIVSLILSALPAHFFVANATVSDPDGTLNTINSPYDNPGDNIPICHWSEDDSKFVSNSPDVSAVVNGTGHGGHSEDIIPPFWHDLDDQDPQFYSGQNWDDDGKSLWRNDCEVLIGSISGAKYDDAGNDGSIDGDTKLEGWTIRLYKVDTPWVLYDSDTTDINGEYEFTDVPEGAYKVCEVMQDDWTQTFVTNGTTNESPNSSEEGPLCQTVNIDEHDEENTKNFGNYYEEPVDFCDPANRPKGKNIAQWHEENQFDGTSCFDYEVVQQCGSLDVQFTRNDSTLGFTFLYVLGSETPDNLDNAESFPASFSEDENGGSVELTYFVVGAESDYFTGSDVPNFWDKNGTTVSVDTDCEAEPPICEIGENLLSNGSFEEPEVTDNKKWSYTDIIDWVITALSDDDEQDGELHRGWSGNEAAHGEQYAELDSRESVQMSQTVDTVPGATYELKWAFAPRHGLAADENQLSVLVDGGVVAAEGPATGSAGLSSGDWTRSSYSFKAAGEETTVTFADAGAKSNSLGTFLDDTALCYVSDPEPEEPEICSYEGEVIYTNQGLTNGGNPVAANRSLVSAVEAGVASYTNFFGKEGNDWQVNPLDFYSLGIGGELVYEFTDKIAVDQPGDDIAIWEITGGNPDQQADEKVEVYLSENGVDYELAGTVTGDGSVDIAATTLSYVKFVKLIDKSQGVQGNNGDGYDLDGITIIEGSCADFVKVVAEKIVCTDESELPNWGSGGPQMTANTAQDWVDTHDSCDFEEGWEFEWAPFSGTSNPGDDHYGYGGGNWNTFGPTDATGMIMTAIPVELLGDKNKFWMREVLQEGYIPFTFGPEGKKNTDDYSAEFYCHTDVLNYDNYDRVDNYEAGETYHCVAWNVPERPPVEYGPYCGDGIVNQLWEQCEIGDKGCTDHCLWDNQCSMEQLVKITLDDTVEASPSFDGSIHLDMAGNVIPNGTWFNFAESVGASTFVDIANAVDGLAVKRNLTDNKLELAFVGGNARKKIDLVQGDIMTLGINLGAIDRAPNPQFKLENGSGNSFDDVFDIVGTSIDFDLRADTGNDGVSVVIGEGEEHGYCPECLATVEARVVLNDSGTAGNGDLSDEIILGDSGYTTVGFGEWFPISVAPAPGDSAVMINDPNTVTNFDSPGDKPGLFVSRENGTVKVALYGEHNPGGSTNNEWIDARIEVRDAEITNFSKLTGSFKFENHNGNNQPSDDYDEASADDTGVDFKMWVGLPHLDG